LALARAFKVKKVSAGERIFTDDKIDEMYLIIKGKTGILNPETKLLNYIKNGDLQQSTAVLR
jgi:signal-transduction protein with cAMP-binding, CBS, and nucleotidyltransferase domain